MGKKKTSLSNQEISQASKNKWHHWNYYQNIELLKSLSKDQPFLGGMYDKILTSTYISYQRGKLRKIKNCEKKIRYENT